MGKSMMELNREFSIIVGKIMEPNIVVNFPMVCFITG
jgi:hypothetical protein